MVVELEWEGKVVGSNRRLMPHRGRLVNTSEYRTFLQSLSRAWQKRGSIGGPVYVRILFRISSRRDMDSGIKPVLDGLQNAGIIENDKLVRGLLVEREDHGTKELDTIKVWVKPKEDDPPVVKEKKE